MLPFNSRRVKIVMKNNHTFYYRSEGFTIIELMVSLVVLSTILLIVTIALMGIGNIYDKGQITSVTQNITTSALNDIVGKIEFSGNTPNLVGASGQNCNTPNGLWCQSYQIGSSFATGRVYAYCIGNYRYSFVLNREVVGTSSNLTSSAFNQRPTYHALYVDEVNNAASCIPLDLFNTNPESSPSLSPGTNGRELLLQNMRLLNFTITPNTTTQSYAISLTVAYGNDDVINTKNSTCKATSGQQFCAVSSMSTSVMMRL